MAKDEYDQSTQDLVARQQLIAVNEQYGDNLPYQRGRIVNECKFYMGQAADAMLEAGKRLIILKENEPHGEWVKVLDDLGLPQRTASRIIKATVKYTGAALDSKRPTLAALGSSKLYELMIEDDEDLAELADGGTLGDLKLDDIDRMSVRELRATLRESRLAKEDQAKVMQDKNAKIDELSTSVNNLSRKLTEKQGLLSKEDPDTETARIRGEAESLGAAVQIDYMRRQLPEAFRLMQAHTERTGVDHSGHMNNLLGMLEREITALREEFNIWGSYDHDAEEESLIDKAEIPAHILEGNE